MSKPITRVHGRNVKGMGYVILEKCGNYMRVKQEGLITADWRHIDRIMEWLVKETYTPLRKFGDECSDILFRRKII